MDFLRPTCCAFVLFAVSTATVLADDKANEFFEKKIRPILVDNCFKCHSRSTKHKGGLEMDNRAALLKGGDSGPAFVSGKPEQSKLIEAVHYKNVDLQMPPKGKLSAAVIADLTTWIRSGAPWPDSGPATAEKKKTFNLAERKQAHWCWQPIRVAAPPAVRTASWPLHPVDRFILAPLEDKKLTPAPPAEARTLLRRAYFDIIGLPPAPADLDAFEKAYSRNPQPALEEVVDRLLATPRFGERWARHWLDLARYGESRGHEFDYTAPNAFQYRDYVIRALNADLPYDQFAVEQIAGDLLARPRLDAKTGFNESILGTGFWFLGEEVHSPVDVRQDQADRFDNRIDVLTKTFLGLTVACARCHDHKFDAISTKDYYSLFGVLESSNYRLARFDTMEQDRRIAAELTELRARDRRALQSAQAAAWQPGLKRLAEYLLAARSALSANNRQRLELLARTHHLDVELLERWLAYLPQAARDGADPLHGFALAAADKASKDPSRLAGLLKPLLDAEKKRAALASGSIDGAEIVFDAAHARPEDWLTDGVVFGFGPTRPGTVLRSADAAHPIQALTERAAAEYDPFWKGLQASGSENDPGALRQVIRAGRTIRTPTFTLKAGRLHYLVRGSGLIYSAVGGHKLIEGPLHGKFVRSFDTKGRFQWITHDLVPYRGQPAHVEFSADDKADLALAMVVQSEKAPTAREAPNRALLELFSGESTGSVEKLAAGYQRLLQAAAQRLGEDRIQETDDALDQARLVNWLLRHPDLMPSAAGASAELGRLGQSYLAAEKQLRGQVKWQSRLAMAIMDGNGVDERVFIRGAPKALGETVPHRFLEALTGLTPLSAPHGSGRLALARQMTDPTRNPLIGRVIVNRVWKHLFGRGIVPSVDNFGVLGELPTHPELLDYLADRFVHDGWSIKKLIRMLVLTRTYQMASSPSQAVDPLNRLWHRMPVRRLEGEAIRDAILSISGRLDAQMYGPSVPVYLTAFQDGRGRPGSGPLDGAGRRSLYLSVRRNFLSSFLLAFDTPTPFSTVGRRTVSDVPAQALILLNDPFVHQQAGIWARRELAQSATPRARIATMYVRAFGRAPTETEQASCADFLKQQAALLGSKPDDPAVWTDLAHVLINAKEFIFLR